VKGQPDGLRHATRLPSAVCEAKGKHQPRRRCIAQIKPEMHRADGLAINRPGHIAVACHAVTDRPQPHQPGNVEAKAIFDQRLAAAPSRKRATHATSPSCDFPKSSTNSPCSNDMQNPIRLVG
jgi:hypothetical protein